MINFMKKWVADLKNFWYYWADDQGTLMNTLLHFAGHHLNKTYNDNCGLLTEDKNAYARNKCYIKTFEKWNISEHKQFGKICLLPTTNKKTRINIHDCHLLYEPGDFGFHSHAPDPKCHILRILL
eukprot:UN27107